MIARKEKGTTLGYVIVSIDEDDDVEVDKDDYTYAMQKDFAERNRNDDQYVAALVVVSD